MRLDAVLSQYGYCSRKEAVMWVKAGRVLVNGQPAKATKDSVKPQEVLVDGEPVEYIDGIYVALHKPLGYTCSHSDDEGLLVDNLLPEQWQRRKKGVQTVGRLDKETSGLLILTDDGQFLHRLTSPKHHVPKVYRFETENAVPAEAVAQFASGEFMLEGERTPCLPAELVLESPTVGCLTLHEGRYHQVRRMLAAVGAPVLSLHRESVGVLQLASLELEPGEWCEIDPSLFS